MELQWQAGLCELDTSVCMQSWICRYFCYAFYTLKSKILTKEDSMRASTVLLLFFLLTWIHSWFLVGASARQPPENQVLFHSSRLRHYVSVFVSYAASGMSPRTETKISKCGFLFGHPLILYEASVRAQPSQGGFIFSLHSLIACLKALACFRWP